MHLDAFYDEAEGVPFDVALVFVGVVAQQHAVLVHLDEGREDLELYLGLPTRFLLLYQAGLPG